MSSSRPRKNKNKNKNSNPRWMSDRGVVDNSADKLSSITRGFTQMCPMNKASINVSTGGVTYSNTSNSSTFVGNNTTNVTSDPCFATFFTLADIPQSSTFTALFDRYRINRVEVTFTPVQNNNQAQSGSVIVSVPDYSLYYVVDVDDASVVAPVTSLMEYEGCKRHSLLSGPITVGFKPHVAVAAYSGAFTSYANQADEWLDCGSPSIQHYGLKWGFPVPLSTGYGQIPCSVTVRYFVEFKNVR